MREIRDWSFQKVLFHFEIGRVYSEVVGRGTPISPTKRLCLVIVTEM